MEVYDVAIVPLILGMVELAKKLGLSTKYCALLSAILGIVIGIVYVAPENLLEGILVGLSLGLAASGLYSGSKNAYQDIAKK